MQRAALSILLGVLFLSPATAWTQPGGDPGQSGISQLNPGILDVGSTGRLWDRTDLDVESFAAAGLIHTPRGILTVVDDPEGGPCILLRTDTDTLQTESHVLPGCDAGRIAGYDPVADRFLVCMTAANSSPDTLTGGNTEWVLAAYDSESLEPAWSLRTQELSTVLAATTSRGITGASCLGLGLDPIDRLVVAPVYSGSQHAHAILALDLDDGAIRWARQIPIQTFFGGANGNLLDSSSLQPVTPVFQPFTATIHDGGIIVTGHLTCLCNKMGTYSNVELASAWFDLDGGLHGGIAAEDDYRRAFEAAPLSGITSSGTLHPAGRGALGVHLLGGRAVIIDPGLNDVVRMRELHGLDASRSGGNLFAAPVWNADGIVITQSHSTSGIDPGSLQERWSWTPGSQWLAMDQYIAGSEVHVLFVRYPDEPRDALLARLDISTGRLLQEIPVPLNESLGNFFWRAKMLPLDDRVILMEEGGNLVELRHVAQPGSTLVSDAYPPIGERVTLTPSVDETTKQVIVNWGDGSQETNPPGVQPGHFYATSGTFRILVTAVGENGTTNTTTSTVHVGGTPPAEPPALNPLQRAFAPENQDMTWGVIGLVIAVLGFLFGYVGYARLRKRLRDGLKELDAIRAAGQADALAALPALIDLRKQLETDLRRGYLRGDQFTALDQRALDIFEGLRLRVLGPFADRLTPGYRALLDAALADADLSEAEATALRDRLGDERGLRDADRSLLMRLIRLLD